MVNQCLVCHSANYLPLETGNKEVNHFICKKCGLIYIWPLPTKSFLESFYEGVDSANMQGVKFESPKKAMEMISSSVLDEARYIIKNSGLENCSRERNAIKVLEIGSSTGILLNAFKIEGFDVTGVEPSKLAARYSKLNYNLNVINGLFEEVKIKEKFDLVLCSHLLEHVNNPIEFLSKIRKVLKKEGILYIKVSNLYKPRMSLKRFFTPLHLINYSPRTLINMLALNNFKAIKADTEGPFIEMFFMKDSKVKLKIDPNEYKKELEFLQRYKRDYFFKLTFLVILFREKVYNKLVNLLVRLLPFSWLQNLRRVFKKQK
jgi:SAM-dependent methyltransferase